MHGLRHEQWRDFFLCCTEILKPGDVRQQPVPGASWCAFTTFSRLEADAGYWTHGLPLKKDIGETWIHDGGIWGQPFPFDDLAHLIVPKKFIWEMVHNGQWSSGEDKQDIEKLSAALIATNVGHRLSPLVLEIKCY